MSTPPPARKIAVPRLLHVGTGCLADVASLLAAHDFDLERVLVGCGPGPSRALAARAVESLRAAGVDAELRPDLTGRLDQAAAMAATIIEDGVTLAMAVGGGRVLDTVKVAAARTRTEFVSVPTTVSNDGISSPVASLVGKDGARASHAARMPAGILVDLAACRSAPAPTSRAGAGDLLSNLTACMDWRLADRAGRDRYDAFAAMIAESAARPMLDVGSIDTEAGHELLAQGLVMSGLAMATAGTSRPCSGAEHLVSHALDAVLGSGAALHGEQVALGCLLTATAHESPLLPALRAAYGRLGLPLRPEDVGLSQRQLTEAVLAAPMLRPDRWTILSERYRDRSAASALVREAFAASTRVQSAASTRSVA